MSSAAVVIGALTVKTKSTFLNLNQGRTREQKKTDGPSVYNVKDTEDILCPPPPIPPLPQLVRPLGCGENIYLFVSGLGLPWQAQGYSSRTKISTNAKSFTDETGKNARYCLPLRCIKRPAKITMYLGLDIIIKLKFTANFDRCAILKVLIC